MPPAPPRRATRAQHDRPPVALHERAQSDLAFMRGVLERSHHFTAVPGVGGVLMGSSAIIAAIVAYAQPSYSRWLTVWLLDAVIAAAIGAFMLVRKARRTAIPLGGTPARRFALGLFPPLLAGGVLTFACLRADAWTLLPPLWLCCYGIAVLGGGAVSAARVVPTLGAAFLGFGALAVATPSSWADIWLGLAFGLGHIVAGLIVARRHGG